MSRLTLAAAALAFFGLVLPTRADDKPAPAKKPKVEVVFCLDTTGSMGGLIEGAKTKIWAIANQIAAGKPTPDLKVGLVAYKDKGDDYVTKVIPLTDDLDTIHAELKKFKAQGGGDLPESVNQALDDSVNKIAWSKDKGVLKIIFLVGDAPPHMDYKDDVKYPETCKKAVERDIIINTVQCGNDADCRKYWQDICKKAEGTYVQIAQEGGIVAIATPFDKDLGEINAELARSTVTYGDAKLRRAGEEKKAEAEKLSAAPATAPAAADRAGKIAKDGKVAAYDLIDAIKEKKVKLEDLKDEDLPDDLRKMKPQERKAHLDKLEKKRDELTKKAGELDKKRGEFIDKKLKEDKKGGKDGFDNQVVEMLRKQAKKYNIEY
ncbi:MAG TPA: VWA domain-containing protein [Gemmataceae bacterium]|nr:VWA domain-containing protein [Gemmataceae bacterium]